MNQTAEVQVARHEEQLKTLFNKVTEIREDISQIHGLTREISSLSKEIENLSRRLIDNNTLLERQIHANTERIRTLEEDKSFKVKYIWQTITGTIVGALVGYLLNLILR